MKLFTTAADPTKAIGMSEGCKADGMRPTPIGEGTEFRCGLVLCFHILWARRVAWHSCVHGTVVTARYARLGMC